MPKYFDWIRGNIMFKLLTDKLIFILEFIYFIYIFYITPPVCDRWMERIGLDKLESFWRCIFTLFRWCAIANARFFSNLFSFLVDYNIIVRSIVNAGMITGCSIMICKMAEQRGHKSILIRFCSVLIFLLSSLELKKEIFYYASTLYISGLFIILLIILLFKSFDKFRNNKTLVREFYLLIFIGCTWIENVSVGVFSICVMLFILKFIEERKIDKQYFLCFVCSFLGLLLMALSAKFGSAGRINGASINLKPQIYNIYLLICSNIVFIFILCFVCLCLARKIEFKRKSMKYMAIVFWSIGVVGASILATKYIYKIVSTDPADKNYVEIVYGWSAFSNSKLMKIYNICDKLLLHFLPIIILTSIIYIVFFALKIKSFYALTALVASGSSFILFFLQQGERIASITIWLLGCVTIIFMAYVCGQIGNNIKKVFILIMCFLVFMECSDEVLFLQQQRGIANARQEIADNIFLKQQMGSWDYEEAVFMPAFTGTTRELIGEDRKNPEDQDIYYNFFLDYYRLNENTIVKFN